MALPWFGKIFYISEKLSNMKKSIITIAFTLLLSFLMVNVQAQDLTSKKGETMLPEEGDYAIGFDADPFLNYVGNFLNSGATAPDADWVSGVDNAIVGKMFKDAQTAYRGRVRLGFGSTSRTNTLMSDAGGSDVEDKLNFSYTDITLGLGMEKRIGRTRVQGVYGAEGLIGFSNTSQKITYGNDLTDGANSTTNFFNGQTANVNSRTTSAKSGATLGVGLRGFAGVEIFVFPKVSLGFEYGWGLRFASNGAGTAENETWDGSTVTTDESTGISTSNFGIDTDNNGGAINIIFYFGDGPNK